MLLVDVGSTFTKLAAIDIKNEVLLAKSSSPTTIFTDVSIGFRKALHKLREQLHGEEICLKERYASSSAAGGLKLIAIGLVPDLTVEAAKRAALGAGAKVLASYGYKLNSHNIREMKHLSADVVLLAGGTNGGDEEAIKHNALHLAESGIDAPFIVAGNEVISDEVEDILRNGGKKVYVTANVLPEINKLNVEPAREVIREVFLKHIIHAKGLDKVEEDIDSFLMPTPMAVLEAARLYVEGGDKSHKREVMVVDIGGATTDVHSVGEGLPHGQNVIMKGLPEPYVKRTVEGDLGVRHNISSIIELAGVKKIEELMPKSYRNELGKLLSCARDQWSGNAAYLPKSEKEKSLDVALAAAAVDLAVERHAGHLENIFLPSGKALLQYGKDLAEFDCVVGTGGPIVYSKDPRQIMNSALFDPHNPTSLKPKDPSLYFDKEYIMFAIGLIAKLYPVEAFRILSKYLIKV